MRESKEGNAQESIQSSITPDLSNQECSSINNL